MIEIKLGKTNGKYIAEAHGHAMYNPGNDIVCSAVSCLFYAFAGYLENFCKRIHICSLDDGDAKIEAEGNIDEAYKMLCVGLMQIEKTYPQNVRCTYIDVK